MRTKNMTESLKDAITLAQAARYFCPVPHVSGVQRWATRGTRGVRLETWLSGGRRVTTPAAIERFLLALNRDAGSVSDDDSTRRGCQAGKALEAIGV